MPYIESSLLLTMAAKDVGSTGKGRGGVQQKSTKTTSSKKQAELYTCPICDDVIQEALGKKTGDDAIECSGSCMTWLHRRCAGLSKQVFKNLSKSSDPFYCPQCRLDKQQLEIDSLRQLVSNLSSKLSNISKELSSIQSQGKGFDLAIDNPSYASVAAGSPDNTARDKPRLPPNPPNSRSDTSDGERKYNVILYGLDEPVSAPRVQRTLEDIANAISVVSSLDSSITCGAVKDHHRLGKFKQGQSRPRPILVKFVRAADAASILAKVSQLRRPYVIKPDRSQVERRREKCLMDVRWSLIKAGLDRPAIKIRKTSLFVNGNLLGQVDSNFNFEYKDKSAMPTATEVGGPPLSELNPSVEDPEAASEYVSTVLSMSSQGQSPTVTQQPTTPGSEATLQLRHSQYTPHSPCVNLGSPRHAPVPKASPEGNQLSHD